ncbi:MAG: peptide ABC transporter substrate-binding protein [Chlamydiales bacterium]
MKKLILFALLIVSCFSCQKKMTVIPPKQILRLNMADDAAALDPRVVRRVKDLMLVRHLFDGLMRIDAQCKPQFAVAEDVAISDDLLTYTFFLRECYWTNGDPVTAHDFVHSWKKTLDPKFITDYAHMLYHIRNAERAHRGESSLEDVGVVALDDRTLVVTLEAPTPPFLELTAFPTFFPVNKRIDEESTLWVNPPGRDFVSNGPFRLKQWIPDQEIILVRNETYWDKEHVYLDGLDISMVGDNNTESYLFSKGELDWLGQPLSSNISTELLGKLKEEGKLSSYAIDGTVWLNYNVEKEPFNNINIRKAFTLAINRSEIIQYILQGSQKIATTPIPPSMAMRQDPFFQDGGIEEAQVLFEKGMSEMGWSRETFPQITLKYPPSERNTKIIQYIQQTWQQTFDLQVDLCATEYQLYRAQCRQGNCQVGTGEWIADYHDPISFLELFKYHNDSKTGSGMNNTNWENPKFISLLDRSTVEKNPAIRRALLKEAEELLMEEMPIAPLYHHAFDYVKKDYVQDVVLSPLGGSDFKSARIR